ncbi:MAG: 4-(cytidine 5'-diphospho)-2-C-methyl-D-erythritol kinase [Mesorhizobium sp.]|nr:4-(cytidine 5'-diphospho)-2-C-methyl-D-erythritol kinase [Mesorhizobium sp.]
MRESAVLSAPAKLNLALHVTGRRADGYHLLETLAVFTEFGDRIKISPAERDALALTGPYADGLALDASNLVVRARDRLRDAFPDTVLPPILIELEKNLPIASGIGGGSSDAATALRGLARFWNLAVEAGELADIAAPLGADLPMCLAARPLLARGTGEALEPLSGWPALDLVLVNPGVPVATAAVFAGLARRDNAALPPLPPARDLGSILGWLGQTRNDLEAPARALAPGIADAIAALQATGAVFSRMSGSGATCFGLHASAKAARLAADAIRAAHPGWFVTATRAMASES